MADKLSKYNFNIGELMEAIASTLFIQQQNVLKISSGF
jgi:hypothetical protein